MILLANSETRHLSANRHLRPISKRPRYATFPAHLCLLTAMPIPPALPTLHIPSRCADPEPHALTRHRSALVPRDDALSHALDRPAAWRQHLRTHKRVPSPLPF